MNAPSIDIRDMLVEESSLGLIFATNLFIGREPTEPGNVVTIFDTSMQTPQLSLDPNCIYLYDSIQIRVRGTDYITAYSLISDIFTTLHGRAETRNGTVYSLIHCVSGPAILDWDEKNRVRFIINFDIQRR